MSDGNGETTLKLTVDQSNTIPSTQMVSANVSNPGVHTFACRVTLDLTLVPDVVQYSIINNITVQGEEFDMKCLT